MTITQIMKSSTSRRTLGIALLTAIACRPQVVQGQTPLELKQKVADLQQAFEDFEREQVKLQERISALSKTVGQLSEGHPPIGSIEAFAGSAASIPDGWMACDGSAVSRKDYKVLFDRITTTWGGGDGSTTFNIPNLEGLFLRGVDTKAGHDPDRGRSVGNIQSFATALPKIPFTTSVESNTHTHGVSADDVATTSLNTGGIPNGGDNQLGLKPGTINIGANIGHHTHTIATGGDAETHPINAAVIWIIKVRGPSAQSGN